MVPQDFLQSFRQKVTESKSFLFHLHPSPDGDCVGSVLALSQALIAQGKEVVVSMGDTPLPDYLKHLPGADQVVSSPPHILLEERAFDIFMALDSSAPHQVTRQVNAVEMLSKVDTIVIDHHSTNEGFGTINWVASNTVATAQMVYQLLQELNWEVTSDMAINLFVGLYTDSGGFQYPPTNAETLRVAADLAQLAPNFSEYIFHIQNTITPEHIYFQAAALNNIELSHNGHIAIALVSYEEMQRRNLTPEHADKSEIANLLKSVVGWNVAVGAVEVEPNVVKASFRTRDATRWNVGTIAARLGGGGHPAAAGVTLEMPLEQAKYEIVQAILAETKENSPLDET